MKTSVRAYDDFDAIIVVPEDKLSHIPLRWYSQQVPELARAIKQAIGHQWDIGRLYWQIQDTIFSVHVYQFDAVKVPKAVYCEAESMPGFLFLEPHPTLPNVFESNAWEIMIWNSAGDPQVYKTGYFIADPDQPIPEPILEGILKALYNYIQGIIKCHGCGKEISFGQIAGAYFAGRYCEKCWESKFRKLEAKESYN